MSLSPDEFGGVFKQFMQQMTDAAEPAEQPFFYERILEHFGADPAGLVIIHRDFEIHEHPNLQLAVDAWLSAESRTHEIFGVIGLHDFSAMNLSRLASAESSDYGPDLEPGPVEFIDEDVDQKVVTCVKRGLFLISQENRRLAVWIERLTERYQASLKLQVMSATREEAEAFLAEIRALMNKRNVYRGKTLSLSSDHSGLQVNFHRLPPIAREEIILPEGLMERIERQTVGFSIHREKLLKAGRHLKRGILFHGPPGTGKTLTAMYLAQVMAERTTLILTGRSMGMLEVTCEMARALQPSIVILEDVDLIAQDRSRQNSGCAQPLLFELLNEMDGISQDIDILFLLTTNRPEELEAALAARPGRVDQSYEIPLPDDGARHRLFELYSRGLKTNLIDWSKFIARTRGASGAFIRELMRRAALFAAESGPDLVIENRHLDEALHELVIQGGGLTRRLLGFSENGN